MTPSDLHFLRTLAETATASGPSKWTANTQLISWFRSDPVAVIHALECAVESRKRPGGLTHSRLGEAIRNLPGCAAPEVKACETGCGCVVASDGETKAADGESDSQGAAA